MRRAKIISSLLLSAWLLPAVVPIAAAQERAPAADQARASELKQRGDVAMDALRYGEAVDAYVQAYAISKDPALLYNRGRALQALGDFPGALEALESFSAAA